MLGFLGVKKHNFPPKKHRKTHNTSPRPPKRKGEIRECFPSFLGMKSVHEQFFLSDQGSEV